MTQDNQTAPEALTWYTRGGSVAPSEKVHSINLAKGRGTYTYVSNCGRCGGQGGSQAWSHTGYVCYECNGSRKGPIRSLPVYLAAQLEKLNASAKKRQDKKDAAIKKAEEDRQAALRPDWELWCQEHDDLLQGMREIEGNDFIADLLSKVATISILTDRQVEAARKFVSNSMARKEERRKDEGSQFIGNLKDRLVFDLTVTFIHDCTNYDDYPIIVKMVHVCKDESGNVVVYFGNCNAVPQSIGERFKVKATVKDHKVRNGINQTIINRPAAI